MTIASKSQSAVHRAAQLQRDAANDGLRWHDRAPSEEGIIRWLMDEVDEFREAGTADAKEDELGDIMMFVVRLANYHELDCERAMERAIEKFSRRIGIMHELAIQRHGTRDFRLLSADQVAHLWKECKNRAETP